MGALVEQAQLYRAVAETFYDDQLQSPNPFRRWIHRRRYQIINSLVKGFYSPSKAIVDFGAGSCAWNASYLPVCGVDVNEGLLSYGRKQGRLRDYAISDACRSGLENESADIVVATELLEHLEDAGSCVREMQRVLRRGGVAVVSVPHDTPFSLWSFLFCIQRFIQGYVKGDEYYRRNCGHIQRFSPKKLKELFTQNGFEVSLIFSFRSLHIFLAARKGRQTPQRDLGDVTVIIPVKDEEKKLIPLVTDLFISYPQIAVVIANDGETKENRKAIGLLPDAASRLTFLDRSQSGSKGLTASVLDAVSLVKTKYFIVMDGDGQHKPQYVEYICNQLQQGSALCVVSRISVSGWLPQRKFISFAGTFLGKLVLKIKRKKFPPDILSGFFGVETDYWRRTAQSRPRSFTPQGYKILFEFLKLCDQNIAIGTVYHVLEARELGLSRINWRVYAAYVRSLLR